MINKEKNFASAVIYVHNAEQRIGDFLKMVISVMEESFEHSEIICVNDSSDDGSVNVIKKTSELAQSTSVSVLNMSFYHGVETAMNAGLDLSIGDFVFEFDNTVMDFDKSEIMNIYHRSLKGYDIVSAAPDKKEKSSSKLFYKVFNAFSDSKEKMHTESFRVLSRRVINRIGAMNKTVPYRKAIYKSSGLKTDTIFYKPILNVKAKTDKMEKKFRSDLASDSLILFTSVGYKFSMTMTALMMIMSVAMVIYSIIIFATAKPVAGWTTTILFLSVAFFGLFAILTIIIKYLQLLINLNFKRKQYSFESIEKLTK